MLIRISQWSKTYFTCLIFVFMSTGISLAYHKKNMTATCIYGGRPSGKFNFTELHGWSNIPRKHFGDPIKDKQNYTPPPSALK